MEYFTLTTKEPYKIIELGYSKDTTIRYIFNSTNYMLLRTEILKNSRIISSSNYKFKLYNNKYLLKIISTGIIAKNVTKNNVDIK